MIDMLTEIPGEAVLFLGLVALAHWVGDRTEARLLRPRTAPAPQPTPLSGLWRPSGRPSGRTYDRTTTPAPATSPLSGIWRPTRRTTFTAPTRQGD